ncbi:hypothetical protein [Luteimonas lutimaris]|uniref:hypothetical protein n=1 Tax=Luteimonas lutimaris TaxID=698645 RepID=UPI0031D6E835
MAVLGVFIAYRQWRTAQNKLKLDLFDRRLLIHTAARDYISSVMTSGRSTSEAEYAYLAGTRGAKWLFNDDIVDYLDKVLWHKICDLGCLQSELEGLPPGQERSEKVRKKAELKKWLFAQMEVLDSKFAPFLRLGH